jgi:rod shape-determining protein MreC
MASKRTVFIIWLLVVIFSVVTANFFSENVRNIFYQLVHPLENFFWEKGSNLSNVLSGLNQSNVLEERNQALLKENQLLSHRIRELEILEEENIVLRKALNLGLREDISLVLTEIISKAIKEDNVIIAKGKNDDVQEGMVLITGERVVVGKVAKVYNDFSLVNLISSPALSFDVEIIRGEKKISALAEGDGNLKIKLKFFPKDEQLEKGDKIYTTSLANVFPKGFLIGAIKEINEDNLSSLREALIEPAFKTSLSDYLFLIENFKTLDEDNF